MQSKQPYEKNMCPFPYTVASLAGNIQTSKNISDPNSISVTSFFAFRQGILFIGASRIGYTAANC